MIEKEKEEKKLLVTAQEANRQRGDRSILTEGGMGVYLRVSF